MVKVSIEIEALHPAILAAMPAIVDSKKVLAAVNDVVGEATERDGEFDGAVRGKFGKKEITVSASGKVTGIKLPKDSPAAHLAVIHWYLQGSRNYFVRVETVELPFSVKEWIAGKQFSLEVVKA